MQEALFTFSTRKILDRTQSKESTLSQRGSTRFQSRRVVPSLCPAISTPESPPAEIRSVEKLLKNGDLYKGALLAGVPDGTGKYLWFDGCMYEGEWARGQASGKGRFTWSSGATYEGEFKDGFMDGEGTFIGINGDTYKGQWLRGKKNGYGEMKYANGDNYQGNWKENLQDGHGKYVCSNGKEYIGELKNGVFSGEGSMTYTNGNRYRGIWENGVPKGKKLFNCADDKFGRKEEESMEISKIIEEDNTPYIPRICIWGSEGDAEDIHETVDNNETAWICNQSICEWETVSLRSMLLPEPIPENVKETPPKWLDESNVKKPGQTVTSGHKNYYLMLNLQLGIRYSVGKHISMLQELNQSDFQPNEKLWIRFPSKGSKYTPSHHSMEFKWKDYCPVVFRRLRQTFEVDPADYMMAICGNESLREFSSPGKSGSVFYLTQDERFMIKTVKQSEIKVLIKMLPNYYEHVCKYPNSLVTKFFGVHCVKPTGGQKIHFVVMGNLFHSEYKIHKRFDLKGSSHKRTTAKPESDIDETTTLKDLDLKYVFRLQSSCYQEFIRQIDRDCEFLEAEKIMDYSLLIGLHFQDDCSRDDILLRTYPQDGDSDFLRGCLSLPNMEWKVESKKGSIKKLGKNTAAKAVKVTGYRQKFYLEGSGSGSINSTPKYMSDEVFDVILYFGIIDILQDYDITKKLEHAYKSLQVDPATISAVDPKLYSRRFREFINKIFLMDKQ